MTQSIESLARTRDMSKEAMALRLRAARLTTGLSQKDAAAAVGIGTSTYNNMEKGVNYPSRLAMRYYYREHRIDFNFFMHGDYNQLPGDVQTKLFAALETATNR